jgi:hypothetical protein
VTSTNPELTGTEQAVMLVLMAESRPVSNTELAVLGPKLEMRSREKLNRLKLIETTKPGRGLVHELTDKGWHACGALLGGPAPARSSGQGKVLYAVLAGLGRYLDRTDQRLADVFWPADAVVADRQEKVGGGEIRESGAETVSGGEVRDPWAETSGRVESRVRDAYSRLAPRPGGWVGLVRLRAELSDVPRSSVDAALVSLYQQPGVSLIPEENQKVLTAADRNAAVAIGDQDKHLIAIES